MVSGHYFFILVNEDIFVGAKKSFAYESCLPRIWGSLAQPAIPLTR